jgi:AcrR family transcriptional regulator
MWIVTRAMVVVIKLNVCLDIVKRDESTSTKGEDADVFAALVRVMRRRGPAELTLREIATEAGLTAGALVQRFGSKRALLPRACSSCRRHRRHWCGCPSAGDVVAAGGPRCRHRDLRATGRLATRRPSGTWPICTTIWPIQRCVVTCCVCRTRRGDGTRNCSRMPCGAGATCGTDVPALARLIEVTLRGSFLNWTVYREGSAADWMREDLETTLRPYVVQRKKRVRQR